MKLVLLVVIAVFLLTSHLCAGEGMSLHFDGIDDFVVVPNSVSLSLVSSITVEAWVKPAYASIEHMHIVSKNEGYGQGDKGYALQTDGSMKPHLFMGSICLDPSVSTPPALMSGVWIHLAGTFDGMSRKFYVNGELQYSIACSQGSALQVNDLPIQLGKLSNYGQWFGGDMDEVRVWRTARTAQQISQYKDLRLSVEQCSDSNLVAYWSFDGDSASIVLDRSPYANNGSIVNGPVWVESTAPLSCCVGVTGNVNGLGIVDLSDLSSLVNYLTGYGYDLPCPPEANVNSLGIVDLSDLSSLVSFLTGGNYVLPECSAPPPWMSKQSMPTGRVGMAIAIVNERIYAIGGSGGMSTVEEYDPATNVWTTRQAMPTARAAAAAAAVNGKIYAIGGWDHSSIFNTVEEYDPASNTWTTKQPMPTARYGLSAVVVNGKIYAIGGCSNGASLVSTVEEYDPVANTWAAKQSMPTARYLFGATVVNEKVYAIGGSYVDTFLTAVEEYHPLTNTWTIRQPMPTRRDGLAAAAVNGKIYALGGWNVSGIFNTVEKYDPTSDTWTTKQPMPTARWYLAAGVVNAKVYAIGGNGGSNTVEEYDPTLDH